MSAPQNNKAFPCVSILIPAFNAASTLSRALESVLAQSLSSWEVLVINDGSTDATKEIAHDYEKRDARIRLLSMPRNSGQSAARNTGFAEARGKWIALLDADDAFLPERLERLLSHAEKNGLDMVADNQLFFDAPLGIVSHKAMEKGTRPLAWTLSAHLANENIGAPFKWGLLKAVLRKAFLDQHKIGYRQEFNMGEDSLFYAELLVLGARAEILPEALYLYTSARGEISRRSAGTSTSRYSLENHMGTYLFFEKTHGMRLTQEQISALDKCKAAARTSCAAELFKKDIRSFRLFSALRRFLKTPSLFSFLWQSLQRYVKSRYLSLRKPQSFSG
jgi:succinoglycan biosynthesis protein ExoO